jgi:6-phosphogluconolactonase/glucosamine-6-phosphate isomerase/deaminase
MTGFQNDPAREITMAMVLHRFEDSTEAAQVLAGRATQGLQSEFEKNPPALLLLSGGCSPLPVFAALLQPPLPWSQIDVSLVAGR